LIKLVVFDLDNVIIDGEAIDEIGKLVNVQEQIAEITKQAMNGDLDFETSIRNRVELLKGASVNDIKELANKMKLMKGADEAILSLKKKGYKVAVISGSFDLIANPLKEKLGLDYVFTNTLVEENGKLTGEVTGPLVEGSKSDVLLSFIEENNIVLNECIAVGDGANDISMLESAKIGIAFNAKPAVKEIADIIVENKDLNEIFKIIVDLDKEYDNEPEIKAEKSQSKLVSVDEKPSTDKTTKPDEKPSTDKTTTPGEKPSTDKDSDVVTDKSTVDIKKDINEKNKSKKEESESSNKKSDKKSVEDSSSENKKPFKKSNNRNELPKTDFVASDDPKEVRIQKNERETLITQITAEREEFNMQAKEQRRIRDEFNNSLKENLKLAIGFRDERDKINEEVEEAKKLRDNVNNELRKLEWSSGRRDRIKLENEIAKIDKIIETRVLDIKKENQLVKNANDLRKQLNEIQEDEKIKNDAQKLKKTSEDYHAKVVELSENAQELHENMLNYFRKTDKIRTSADEAHRLFVKAKKSASAKHEDFKRVLSEIHVINKKLGDGKSKRRSVDKQANIKKNREEKERAEEIFEKFKNGKKLSTEELLLLQRHNIS
jgi:phosphoserine phosphatase